CCITAQAAGHGRMQQLSHRGVPGGCREGLLRAVGALRCSGRPGPGAATPPSHPLEETEGDRSVQIVIPTYRRVGDQVTFRNLPRVYWPHTEFVANEEETPALKLKYGHTGAKVVTHPPEIDSIAKKRAWILANTPHEKIFMLDDDLKFAVR